MNLNDHFFVGTKWISGKFEDETHNEEIPKWFVVFRPRKEKPYLTKSGHNNHERIESREN